MSELTKALVEVQANLPQIHKGETAKVGAYSYKYADLPTITAEILPVLSKHGLAWTTRPTFDDNGTFVLAYELRHIYGEALAGWYPLPDPSSKAQEIGSAITYSRRYALCSVVGIAPDEDDDGQAAQQARHGTYRAKSSRSVDTETGEISDPPDVWAAIEKLSQEGRKALQAKLDAANYPPLDSLPSAAAKTVIKWAEEIKAAEDKGAPF
jgi:hypothetical protein